MLENLQQFIEGIKEILNNRETSIEQKIEIIVTNYIDLFVQQPDLPLFVLHELRTHPKEIISKIDRDKFISKSYFMQQIKEAAKEGKVAPVNPLHFLMNIVGLTIFPFVASPVLRNIGGLNQQDFNSLMEERKKLIPKWIKAIMQKK